MPRLEVRPISSNMGVLVRDSSPMEVSRFARPLSPPDSKDSSPSNSPTCDASIGYTVSSHPYRSDSIVTPLTSIDGGEDCTERRCFTSFDEWFAQQDSDSGLAGMISDECPDRATLAAVQHLPVYDADGTARPFGSLFDPATAPHERQLLVFIRHFFCGACQAYLNALAAGVPMRDYFAIPVPTSIIVIGCGQPHLIPHYRTFTNCPFPIFADPSRKLFKKLGMTVSFNLGRHRPQYMHDISATRWIAGQATTISRSLKDADGIRKRDVFQGGNPMQIGGEFLFEDGQVIWCHRMKNYRGHAEISEVRKVLGLDE